MFKLELFVTFLHVLYVCLFTETVRREERWDSSNDWDGHHGQRSSPPPPPPPHTQPYSATGSSSSQQYSAIPTTYQQHPAHIQRPATHNLQQQPQHQQQQQQPVYESYNTASSNVLHNHYGHQNRHYNYQNSYHQPPQ